MISDSPFAFCFCLSCVSAMSGVHQPGGAMNGIEAGVVNIAAPAALPAAAPPLPGGSGPPASPLQAAVLGDVAIEPEVPAVPSDAMADRAFHYSTGARVYYNPLKAGGMPRGSRRQPVWCVFDGK